MVKKTLGGSEDEKSSEGGNETNWQNQRRKSKAAGRDRRRGTRAAGKRRQVVDAKFDFEADAKCRSTKKTAGKEIGETEWMMRDHLFG